MKRQALIAVAAVACTLAACSDDNVKDVAPKRIELSASEQAVVQGSNDLAYRTFDKLYESGKNTAFSPLSAQMALAMTANGATDETLDEIVGALCPGGSLETVNSLYAKLNESLPVTDARSTVSIANSAWHDRNIAFTPTFEQAIAVNYGAPTMQFDINSPAKAAADINSWISGATHDKIDNMLTEYDVRPFMLVNALYFKSEWKDKFDKDLTKRGKFTNVDNTTTTAMFMKDDIDVRYTTLGTTQIAELSFGNDAYRMVLVLPEEGKGAAEALAEVGEAGPRLYDSMKEEEVYISLPRFKARTKSQLQNVYKSLGIERAFDAGKAQFGNMLQGSGSFISYILHECCVEVDEDGATAAAATVAGGLTTAQPGPAMICDHPFAYMIRETSTGMILFMGVIDRM